jgi:hypothetical protein
MSHQQPMAPANIGPDRWRQIETICQAALGLDAAARPAYLVRACADDAALRREVEELLAQEGAASGFLSQPPEGREALLSAVPGVDLIGRTIGDYEILGRLGSGGMGVVYRAKDLTLGREVAIKVLPAEVATSPERLSRFRREAKLLATLSHPNVGAIYGLVETQSTCALVLELLEGETLVDALSRGPMKSSQALSIGIAIARALDHVHSRGITHRDLKPSNIFLTASGPKLLDFGVGKWSAATGAPAGFTTQTAEGTLVGTLNYMAPEQLESGAIGPRSDVFAFGAVMYEMVTGRRAFDGPSGASIVAAIINSDAPRLVSGRGEPTPARLERAIAKCLAKDPDARWQTARDLAGELETIAGEMTAGIEGGARRSVSRPLAVAAAVAVLAALALAGWASRDLPWGKPPAPVQTVRLVIAPPPDRELMLGLAIAPDGSQIVFRTRGSQDAQLTLRRLDQFDPVVLEAAQGISPAFSPDGRAVAYISRRRLYRVDLDGAATPTILAEVPSGAFDVDWSVPDTIVFGGRELPVSRVPASGGVPVAITDIRRPAELDHHSPQLLPGGEALLYLLHRQRNRFSIVAQSLRTGTRTLLIEDGYAPSYSPTGHLLFGRASNLLAVPFDVETLTIRGAPTTLLEGIAGDFASGEMEYAISRSGTLVYRLQSPRQLRTLAWVDRSGKETPLPHKPDTFEGPRISPDGKQIAFGTADPHRVWVYEVASDKLMPVTGPGHWGPMWTHDGSALLYAGDRPQAAEILRHPLAGGPPVVIGSSINDLWPAGFAVDGTLIVNELPPTEINRVSRIRPGPAAQPEVFADQPGNPNFASVSPDGRWVAFTGHDGTRPQVFVKAVTGDEPPKQISVDGGWGPVWRRDGRELFYRFDDGMFSVSINAGAGLIWGKPTLLFRGSFTTVGAGFDVGPDGRFVVLKPVTGPRRPAQLNAIVNWATELIARVPKN